MTKQQTIDLLKAQLPGFYSVEQVIELISKIEEPKAQAPVNLYDLIEEACQKVSRRLSNANSCDLVDLSSAEFELSYDNRIELSNVEVYTDSIIEDYVQPVLESVLHDFFPAPEVEESNATKEVLGQIEL
jgi:hypothetical protein